MRELFDPATLRPLGQRVAFVRRVGRPALVLGSTQSERIVDPGGLADAGIELLRRRSGGGAVLLEPGASVWVDTWVPRGDALWDDDVSLSRAWVGEWWVAALGVPGLEVHHGAAVSSRWSELICFAGIAAGEVLHEGRKLLGVAQWRAREGALTHSFAHLWAPWRLLCGLLLPEPGATEAADELAASSALVGELAPGGSDRLVERLLGALPDPGSWEIRPA